MIYRCARCGNSGPFQEFKQGMRSVIMCPLCILLTVVEWAIRHDEVKELKES